MRRSVLLSLTVLLLPWGLVRAAAPTEDFKPDPRSVRRHGPAYRYPQAGWIVLHIEGEPYERGYQHGWLMAPEIASYVRCFAAMQGTKAPTEAWKVTRTLVNALFLRRFDKEYLEEMKGIADGAVAAGAKFDDRPLDLVDIVALNCWAEVETLDSALEATPTGLEGIRFPKQQPRKEPPPKPAHCSAFAATGPATKDGKIVFGHVTMFNLYPSLHFNVWLDVKPTKGHRILMQSHPGGIQSGMDYYQNDAGLLLLETTIDQTRFHQAGMTVANRTRKAMQYADSIDAAVDILLKDNNGLYTNEWMLGDTRTNEIAMLELGTTKHKLWRSSKGEWFGGTEGFYWGCNNTKDLQVRLDTVASTGGRPANMVWRPDDRDRRWLELYDRYKGKIDADFGKIAFTTPPLCSAVTIDAKYTTTDLAKQLKSWALWGPPRGKSWQPTDEEKQHYPEIRPLASNPWTILHGQPPAREAVKGPAIVDLPEKIEATDEHGKEGAHGSFLRGDDAPPTVPAWHGTLLPKTDADIWLATAFADYEKIVALENALRDKAQDGQLSTEDREQVDLALFAHRSNYLAAARIKGDVPLMKIRAENTRDDWHRIASGKGVLLLHELRRQVGREEFEKLLDQFGRKHAGQEVTSQQFREHCEQTAGKKLNGFFERWLQQTGLPTGNESDSVYSVLSFLEEPEQTLIIYGTGDEEAANREAAEALREAVRTNWCHCTLSIKSDRDVKPEELKTHHLLLIGRPDSNSLVKRAAERGSVRFGSRSFVIGQEAYAHPGSGVVAAAANPDNPRYSVVILAGLSAEATGKLPAVLVKKHQTQAPAFVVPNGKAAKPVLGK